MATGLLRCAAAGKLFDRGLSARVDLSADRLRCRMVHDGARIRNCQPYCRILAGTAQWGERAVVLVGREGTEATAAHSLDRADHHDRRGWTPSLRLRMAGPKSRDESGKWAFDAVAYDSTDADRERLLVEVKKSDQEIGLLVDLMSRYAGQEPLQHEPRYGPEKNAYRKVRFIRSRWSDLVWALGPGGRGQAVQGPSRRCCTLQPCPGW